MAAWVSAATGGTKGFIGSLDASTKPAERKQESSAATAGIAGTPPGCGLRGAGIRWCRDAQPPATGWHPSGEHGRGLMLSVRGARKRAQAQRPVLVPAWRWRIRWASAMPSVFSGVLTKSHAWIETALSDELRGKMVPIRAVAVFRSGPAERCVMTTTPKCAGSRPWPGYSPFMLAGTARRAVAAFVASGRAMPSWSGRSSRRRGR